MNRLPHLYPFACAALVALALLSGCGATAQQVIPTARPTITATFTASPTRTPGGAALAPSATNTRAPASPTFGPSPTSLLGPTSTGVPIPPTRPPNPNAPRIEFFTSDVLAIAPGGAVTLYWSTRGVDNAVIYRLDASGQRAQLWNVGPDGSLTVPTRASDRDEVSFVLSIGDGVELGLTLPISCPETWFFTPAPETCPSAPSQTTPLLEETFERGRMLYVAQSDRVYALFNDGQSPAWVSFQNLYDPAIHPAALDNFIPPPGLYQPLAILGFVWRGNDVVRNRLGLALAPEAAYEGFIQVAIGRDGRETLYASSADGTVLELLPGGDSWQIITPSAP